MIELWVWSLFSKCQIEIDNYYSCSWTYWSTQVFSYLIRYHQYWNMKLFQFLIMGIYSLISLYSLAFWNLILFRRGYLNLHEFASLYFWQKIVCICILYTNYRVVTVVRHVFPALTLFEFFLLFKDSMNMIKKLYAYICEVMDIVMVNLKFIFIMSKWRN